MIGELIAKAVPFIIPAILFASLIYGSKVIKRPKEVQKESTPAPEKPKHSTDKDMTSG